HCGQFSDEVVAVESAQIVFGGNAVENDFSGLGDFAGLEILVWYFGDVVLPVADGGDVRPPLDHRPVLRGGAQLPGPGVDVLKQLVVGALEVVQVVAAGDGLFGQLPHPLVGRDTFGAVHGLGVRD